MTTNDRCTCSRNVSARIRTIVSGLIALTIAMIGATVGSSLANAATYACKNADGITEFRVTKCPRATKTRSVRRAENRSRRSKNRKSLRQSRRDSSAMHRSAQRQISQSKASKRAKRKSRNRSRQSHARNGFDPATCRAYKKLLDKNQAEGVEYIDNQGRSTYRTTREAKRKLRKAQRLYQNNCG